VKNVDLEKGIWKNIFIYNEDVVNNVTRLISSESGRIDFSGESNELVLEKASIATIPVHLRTIKNIFPKTYQFASFSDQNKTKRID
jgi:hypothetical protein